MMALTADYIANALLHHIGALPPPPPGAPPPPPVPTVEQVDEAIDAAELADAYGDIPTLVLLKAGCKLHAYKPAGTWGVGDE